MRRFRSCMTLVGTLSGLLVISSLLSPVDIFSTVTAHAEEGAQVVAEGESLDAEPDDVDELTDESLPGVDDGVAESPEEVESEAPAQDEGATLDSEDHQDGPPNPKHMWSPENMDGESGIMPLAPGPYWTTKNGQKAFYDGYGSLYASPALKVIDVSEWQGSSINWDAVAADGVDAAILRIGWGDGSEDRYFARNLSEVRRIGMPYGVYLYSYAYDANFAREEANSTADLLDKYNCKDLSLPIYYDIEKFNTWEGHVAPSSPKAYEEIIRTYIDTMAARGYTNVHVYTYRSYLQNELNSTYIRQRTSWIAEYGSRLNVTNNDYSGQYGWQYTDADRVNGISGNVDMSAFSDFDSLDVTDLSLAPQISNGVYYIDSLLKPSSSVDIAWGSVESGAHTHLYSYNKSDAQKFEFVKQSDGSYVIRNINSGLVLDVKNGEAGNGAVVQQFASNNTASQKWFIRDSGSGYYIQTALGNWVLNIEGESTKDGTKITLHSPNNSDAQKFMLASDGTELVEPGEKVKVISTANAGYVFDIDGGSKKNSARLQIYSDNGTDSQVFWFDEVGNGLYTLTSAVSGKLIEVSYGLTSNGSAVAQYEKNSTASQYWAVRDYGSGSFSLLSVLSGKAIDVPSGTIKNGNKLQIYTPNGTAAQLWRVKKATISRDYLDQLARENRDVLTDGDSYFIRSAKDSSRVIDVQWGSSANGANIWLFSSNNTSTQRWSVETDDVGYVTLVNELTGKALDVKNGTAANRANVQQWESNQTWSQKWIAVRNDDGSITLLSALAEGYAMDLDDGSTSIKTNVQLYEDNGTDAQKFIFDPAPLVVEDGTYAISSALNRDLALDVQWGSVEEKANVWLYENNGSDAQRWRVTNEADGTLKIVNVASGKLLDLMWGGTTSGTNVWQYTDNGTPSQRWRAIRNFDGSVTLRSVLAPSLALDVSNGVATSRANIQAYERNSTIAQNFFFEKAE